MPLLKSPARIASLLVAIGLCLTGCTNSGANTNESTTSQADEIHSETLPEAEGTTNYPLTFSSPWGETVLEERPERIAVLGGAGDGEAAIALGATLVTSPWESADHWEWLEPYADQLTDATYIDAWGDTLPLEQLAAAEPDVILAYTHTALADQYSELSAIAPVLAQPTEEKVTWQDTTRAIGEVFDLQNAAQELIDGVDESIDAQSGQNPEYEGKTLSILVNRGSQFGVQFINTKDSYTEELLSDLGFAPHPNVDQFATFEKGVISPENFGLIDADAIIVAQHGGMGSAEEAKQWLESNQLYANLEAVQAGKVSEILPNPETGTLDIAWAFSWPNALSIHYILDTMDEALTVL